ncbi:MAG: glycosyltransferase [Crocinitomicaceae bacterium]|nr:glycosyltransferase [Crocinitomicaceae bacterium]
MQEFLPELDYNLSTYIFICLCFAASVQFLYLTLIYSRLAFHKDKSKAKEYPPVSIIIAARNESQNLFKNLPFILDQDYPEFEVIIINHQSLDDSQYILDAYKQQYKNLRVITVERSKHLKYGKKLPLTIGIKGAAHEHLLFTDADCKPQGNQWLKSMGGHFTDKHQIVLGYGPYYKSKGMLNRAVRFDTAWIAMSYFSMAKARMPYMGIGRNMAYTRTAFNNVSGFKSHYSLSSGDDDLFIQEAAKKKNYTINIDPDSFCFSNPAKSWGQWTKQKSRHYTTSGKYQVIKKLMLGIYPLSLLILVISFVTLLLDSNFIWAALAIFGFILIVKWIILGLAFRKLKESKFIAFLPLLDIAYAILTPVMYYAIDKTDKNKW